MSINLEKIMEKFTLFSGEDITTEDSRARLCVQLCRDCAAEAEAKLSGLEKAEAYADRLESWIAAEAFYQLCLADEAATPESISADGVQIKEGERSAKARKLASEKRRAILPLLGEEAFYFGKA